MSQETVRFSSSAWRAVGATIASQGSQGQASPVQEEAPAASLTAATNSADSFLDSFLQEAERDAVGEAFKAGRSGDGVSPARPAPAVVLLGSFEAGRLFVPAL